MIRVIFYQILALEGKTLANKWENVITVVSTGWSLPKVIDTIYDIEKITHFACANRALQRQRIEPYDIGMVGQDGHFQAVQGEADICPMPRVETGYVRLSQYDIGGGVPKGHRMRVSRRGFQHT